MWDGWFCGFTMNTSVRSPWINLRESPNGDFFWFVSPSSTYPGLGHGGHGDGVCCSSFLNTNLLSPTNTVTLGEPCWSLPSSSLPRVIGAHRPFHHKMVATRGRTCYYSRFLWGSLVLPAGWKPYQQSFSASSPWWEDLKGPVMLQGTAVRWRESFPRPCRGINTTEFTLWNKYKQGKNGTMFVFFPHLNKHNSWKKIRQTLILEDKSFLGNIKILWQIWSVCQSSQYKYLSEVFATPPDSRSEVWALTSTTGSHNISLNGTDVFTRVGLCQSWSHKVSSQINIRFSSRTSE